MLSHRRRPFGVGASRSRTENTETFRQRKDAFDRCTRMNTDLPAIYLGKRERE
jgi:hypothetical protein